MPIRPAHASPPSVSQSATASQGRAPAGFGVKRAVVAAATLFAAMQKVDASALTIEFGKPVAGALNLPPSFAPRLRPCFADPACQRSVLEKAPNIIWRQAMAISGAPLFGEDHLASETAALTQYMDWKLQRFDGAIGYPQGVPVIGATVFGDALTFSKTASDPLGCKNLNRAVDIAAQKSGIAIIGEYHSSAEAKKTKQCLFERIHSDKIVVLLEGLLKGPAIERLLEFPSLISPVSPRSLLNVADRVGGLEHPDTHILASAVVVHGRLSVDVESLIDPPKSLNAALQNFINRLENASAQGRQRLLNIAQSKRPYAALAKTIYQAVMDPSATNVARLQQALNPLPRRLMADFLHEYMTQTVRELDPSLRLDGVQTYLNTPTTALFEVAYYASSVRARDKTFAQSVAEAKTLFPDHQIIALIGGDHALHTASLATTMVQLTHDEL